MCGITGIIQFDGRLVAESELRRMTDRLRHRGPDGSGYRLEGQVGLGHRRLSIIDLEGGAQPMSNEDGTVWITFNGEIYNYQDLQRELRALGHQFRTASDTEVIVHAYEQWGEACVERFRGMFAFAIWDQPQGRLFLARDRLGIKPLCYWHTPQRFCFASELQAFEELDQRPREVDLQAIDYYLELLYIPAPRTIFRGVRKLQPGHTLTVRADGSSSERQYWKLEFHPEERVSEGEWIERLDAALAEAVRRHLVADVPVGSLLSSGLDSGLVTAYAARQSGAATKTFSIGFQDREYNEADGAAELAAALGTEHREQYVDPDGTALLPDLVRHYGEPLADCSAVPMFAVSRLAREGVKVAVSGDGGDEAFAGYVWLVGVLRAFELPTASLRLAARRLVARTLNACHLFPNRTDALRTLMHVRSCFDATARQRLWKPAYRRVAGDRSSLLDESAEDLRGLDLCSQIQLLDFRWYLPSDILFKVDGASMYHSLEVRVPLLDHRLVELAGRIPWHLKIRSESKGPSGALTSKYIFRQLARHRLPPGVADRPKKGFGLPLHRWLATQDSACLRRSLLDPVARLADLFSVDQVSDLVTPRDSARPDGARLWSLSVLAEWFRQHQDIEVR